MIKEHLLLESEKKIRFIDAKKYEERRLFDICTRVHLNSPQLLKEQQIVLHDYFEFLLAGRRLKPRSIYTYMHHLSGMAKNLHKPFSNVTKEDLIKYFASLREERQIYIL